MANKSGTITGTAAGNGNYLYIVWEETATSIPNNTSTVKATVYLYNAYGSFSDGDACPWYVIIDGSKYSGTIYYWGPGSPVTVGTASKVVTHNANGSKSITISAYFDTAGTSTGKVSANGTATLTTLPRYATSTQSLASKTETSVTMNWESDSTIDYIWYSVNNGSTWTAVSSVNASSGSYTISGLTPNTSYNIKTRVRRKDSQLTTDSAALAVATYAYPYCSAAPTFTIGDAANLTIYNPLAREVSVTVKANDNTVILNTTTTGTTATIPTTSADALYASIPNAKTGTYTVTVVYSASTQNATGTYTAGQAAAPTLSTATYQDADASIVAITGNNQIVIPGKSKLSFNVTGLSAKNYASISAVSINVNNTDYNMTISGASATVSNIVVNSSEQTTATVTVTDSRGLTTTQVVNLNITEYILPTVSATAARVAGYYAATEVTPTANYTYVGNNAVTILLQARKVGTTPYTVSQTIPEGTTSTVNLNNVYPWEILLIITDSFGGSTTFNLTIGKGIPLFYFDIVKSSVSVDMFPIYNNSFEIAGEFYGNDLNLNVDIYAQSGDDFDIIQALIALGWEDLGGIDTGLIDWRTNEAGSIPQNGVPATNSTFNRTLLIEVTPSAEYTFKTDGTAENSTIRIHGYDSAGVWLRQLTTVSWTGTETTKNVTIPADVYYVRISYPKLNLYGTGLFEGAI